MPEMRTNKEIINELVILEPLAEWQPDNYCRSCGEPKAKKQARFGNAAIPTCENKECIEKNKNTSFELGGKNEIKNLE